jgi:hypothetical protein
MLYRKESTTMCDYSLQNVQSRPAVVGERLVTRNFGTGTRGFCPADNPGVAVCVLPGTELAFDRSIESDVGSAGQAIAIFRQVNKDIPTTHHDALELPDGRTVMLTTLIEGQRVTVLQLPAQPKTPQEAAMQSRAAFSG